MTTHHSIKHFTSSSMSPSEELVDISRMLPFRSLEVILSLLSTANFCLRDSIGGKPWVDYGSATAARDFWKANATWLATWGAGDARGMTVKSVKMWQEGACP
jgi:hypothetical protein